MTWRGSEGGLETVNWLDRQERREEKDKVEEGYNRVRKTYTKKPIAHNIYTHFDKNIYICINLPVLSCG